MVGNRNTLVPNTKENEVHVADVQDEESVWEQRYEAVESGEAEDTVGLAKVEAGGADCLAAEERPYRGKG